MKKRILWEAGYGSIILCGVALMTGSEIPWWLSLIAVMYCVWRLAEVIDALAELLKLARKAGKNRLDVATFERVLKDQGASA